MKRLDFNYQSLSATMFVEYWYKYVPISRVYMSNISHYQLQHPLSIGIKINLNQAF